MNVHTVLKKPADLTLNNVRHYILEDLRRYNKKYRKDYGNMVICYDNTHGGNWRHDYFPEYKAARKINRKKSTFEWDKFFGFFDIVKQELKDYFPYKIIDIPLLEADDVVGHLCEYKMMGEPIMIISADHDFGQLQRYGDDVKQYSYITRKYIKQKQPLQYLKEHIIRGDAGDGVPNIYSDNDVFINKDKKQKSIMTKDLERWMLMPEQEVKKELAKNLLKKVKKPTLEQCQAAMDTINTNWIRNEQMVDLSLLPKQYVKLIEDDLELPVTAKANKLYSYFLKNKLTIMINYLDDFL